MFAGIGAVWSGVPAWAFWAAALLCFFYTSFRVWQKEHRKVVELTEKPKITFAVHGIPCPQAFGQHRFLFIPEVTVANHSYGKTVAVDVELSMLGGGGFMAMCPAAGRSVEEWEQLPESRGFSHIAFPLQLNPRGVAKGYLAFRPPIGLGGQVAFSPLRSSTGGARCQIRFTDCHSNQLLHEQEIEFYGI